MRGLAILGALAIAATAHADPSRVVIASTDRGLITAVNNAFGPAGMTVVEIADVPPSGIAELTRMSRTVAEREAADAVIWLLVDAEATSATLVAYHRKVDRVLVRPLPYGAPLTAAGAAETARAARTMLRALAISDEPEVQPPPIVPEVREVTPPPPPPRRWANASALVAVGGRYGRLGEDGVIEAQLGVAWRLDALGAVVMASLSPRATLSSPAFMGEVSDTSFAIAARIPFRIAPRIDVAGLAGPAVHVVGVDGTIGAEKVSVTRVDAALRVGATGSYAVSERVDVGLSVSMDSLLRRQRYEVTGGQVLVMPRLQLSVGLMIAVRVL